MFGTLLGSISNFSHSLCRPKPPSVNMPTLAVKGPAPESTIYIGNDALKGIIIAIGLLSGLVNNAFECSICLDTYTDAHVVPVCQHHFCGVCIKDGLRKCNNESSIACVPLLSIRFNLEQLLAMSCLVDQSFYHFQSGTVTILMF